MAPREIVGDERFFATLGVVITALHRVEFSYLHRLYFTT
jgi:hypothetical protein